jgi:hypothetical protein
MKVILSILLNVMFVFLIPETNQSPKAQAGGVVLKLNPPEGVLKSSSEITLYVLINNITDLYIGIVRSPGEIPEEHVRYRVDVRDSYGKRPQETRSFKSFNSPSAIVRTSNIGRYIKPGESVTDAIELTKLKAPGRYRVWVSRSIPDSDGVVVKSNEITIEIEMGTPTRRSLTAIQRRTLALERTAPLLFTGKVIQNGHSLAALERDGQMLMPLMRVLLHYTSRAICYVRQMAS